MSAGLSVLARLAAARPQADPGERCDLCGERIAEQHQHVVNVGSRALLCSCRPCYLLFTHDDAALAYRAVPDRYLSFPDVELAPGEWDELQVPVSTVFLFAHSGLERVVAFYPSPAGATESELPLDSWDRVAARHPALATLRPDVEALLLRATDSSAECFLVPIDACYELVGHLRRLWRGFDGGQDVHRRLDAFFADVRARARPAP
ncbi:MAG: DUF5947 family protein [Mycobacteriales bacterium]